MDFKLTDKVALITGTGSQRGYGKGIALVLAREGCHIVSADIDLEGAKKTAEEVKKLGPRAIAVKVDVVDANEVEEMTRTALREYGKKGGVVAFTESLSKEVAASGVVVNGVHPGLGDTGLNYLGRGGRDLTDSERDEIKKRFNLKRFCSPEDMGVVVAFLASDVCSYMVGQFIHMTGTDW